MRITENRLALFVALTIAMIVGLAAIIIIEPVAEAEWDQGSLYQKCNEMYLGDNWTGGLNLTLAKQCWEQFK